MKRKMIQSPHAFFCILPVTAHCSPSHTMGSFRSRSASPFPFGNRLPARRLSSRRPRGLAVAASSTFPSSLPSPLHHSSPSAMWRAARRWTPPLPLRRLSSDAAAPKAPRRRRVAALWGNGDYGRLGLGALESRWSPTACPFFLARAADPPASLACGGAHTLFLTRTHAPARGSPPPSLLVFS